MTARRVQVLFLVALLGVLALLGVVAGALGGPLVAVVYAVGVGALLVVGARAARRRAAPVAGRTCSCCTTTVHDPVQVR